MADGKVVDFDVARLEGRDHEKLKQVVRLLIDLRLDNGHPLTLQFTDAKYLLVFGKIEEDSRG